MKVRLRTLGAKLKPSAQSKVRLPAKKAEGFYTSAEWRSLIDAIMRRRGKRCEDADHDPARPRTGIRVFGDHIIERKDGGAPLDPANVMLRCGSCHTRKAAEVRPVRYHGRGGGSNL
jgi:hypothetical protein